MFKRYILISGLTFLGLGISGCGEEKGEALDPIPTLQVRAGVRKGFDLGVYKREAEARLWVGKSEDLEVEFLEAKDSLYLLAPAGGAPLVLLQGRVDGEAFQLLVRVAPMVKHLFTYSAAPPGAQVFVMGGFNDWSRTGLKLTWKDGIFQREVLLPPQRHEYKFVVNGAELLDPLNPDSVSNNLGGWNSLLDLSAHQARPAGRIVKAAENRKTLNFTYVKPEDQQTPTLYYLLFNNHLLHHDQVDFDPTGGVKIKKSRLSSGVLRITGMDSLGRVIPENQTLLVEGQSLNPGDHPEDWHFMVLYSVMVDRFLDGDSTNDRPVEAPDLAPLANWQGGDLAGLIQKLEEGYFRGLGVNALWLSPLQRQPDSAYVEWVEPHRRFTGYHGYWPVASRELDPRFGTAGELKRLVSLAHHQGIRVILDFVSNHVHRNHPYYREHPEWFTNVHLSDGSWNIRRWDGATRLTTWFDTFLPSFDYLHAPTAIRQVTDDALWWLTEFNLDGFRQDAVKHVPHRFWRAFTRKMKSRTGRNIYQIGETFGSDELILSYVNPGELSAQFNFAVYFNARGPFSADRAAFGPLGKVLEDNFAVYGPVNLMGNITSSHDQVRFMAFADGQMAFSENGTERAFTNPPGEVRRKESYLKLANFQAFNSSLPGVPVVYYGEEIGLMGAGDPDNRRTMKFAWNRDEAELKQEFDRLNRLRTTYPALALGDWIPVLAQGPLLVYLKVYFNETILVAFNQSPERQAVDVALPLPFTGGMRLAGEGSIKMEANRAILTLPPYSHFLILSTD